MKRRLFVFVCLISTLTSTAQDKPLYYKDARQPVDVRTADLLGRMTIEEKVGQLICPLGWGAYSIDAKRKNVEPSDEFKRLVDQDHVGMLWATFRADPWTKKTLDNGLTPTLAAKAANALQRYAIEHSRLGIPVFLAEEAPHGHMAIGTTVFPTGIGMAATWSEELVEEIGNTIGKEIRLQGAHISYGPILDLAREPRWSRVEETFGEDPVLTGNLGAAMVRGLGGGRLGEPYSTIATLKHFIAYGTTEGGQNGLPSFIGTRELKEYFLPPFKKAVDAGALSVMTSYNAIDGMPNTANKQLFSDLLRDEWGFNGFVVSDLYSIDGLFHTHHVVANRQQAGITAIDAGVDVDLGGLCHSKLIEAVKSGKIDEKIVDKAVERVLRLKFEMGLFDHPYVDEKTVAKTVGSKPHRDVALEAARASITLLKNDANTLPLSKDLKVAIVGPNADNVYNMLGDYTAPQADGHVVTVVDGIKSKIGKDHVIYAKGCAVRDTTQTNIGEAIEAARQADVVIAVVGGSSARDFKTSYEETGAAQAGSNITSDMECGEGYDRATLDLMGNQQQLLDAMKATGKKLIVIYIEGRPLLKQWSAENADALLTAYYPGEAGGEALADVVFGDYNPAGRLPYSVPRSVGQLPVYYNKRLPAPHKYVETEATPLYPFGYGLSYTSFDYRNMKATQTGNRQFEVSLDIVNTGNRAGDEVVQLYMHDEQASTVRPIKQLIHFKRLNIGKGETQNVRFTIDEDDLKMVGQDMKWTVEPGSFKLMAGSSSDDIRQEITIQVK